MQVDSTANICAAAICTAVALLWCFPFPPLRTLEREERLGEKENEAVTQAGGRDSLGHRERAGRLDAGTRVPTSPRSASPFAPLFSSGAGADRMVLWWRALHRVGVGVWVAVVPKYIRFVFLFFTVSRGGMNNSAKLRVWVCASWFVVPPGGRAGGGMPIKYGFGFAGTIHRVVVCVPFFLCGSRGKVVGGSSPFPKDCFRWARYVGVILLVSGTKVLLTSLFILFFMLGTDMHTYMRGSIYYVSLLLVFSESVV